MENLGRGTNFQILLETNLVCHYADFLNSQFHNVILVVTSVRMPDDNTLTHFAEVWTFLYLLLTRIPKNLCSAHVNDSHAYAHGRHFSLIPILKSLKFGIMSQWDWGSIAP